MDTGHHGCKSHFRRRWTETFTLQTARFQRCLSKPGGTAEHWMLEYLPAKREAGTLTRRRFYRSVY